MRVKKQVLRFLSVGLFGTILHYLTLIILVSLLGIGATLSTVVGTIVGGLSNYILNRKFSFNSSRSHRESLPRYALLVAMGLLLNGFFMYNLIILKTHYLVAQLLSTLLIFILNFFVSKKWIFLK